MVTSNLTDVPEDAAEPYSIEVLHPDQFCLDLLDLAPELTIRAIEARAAQYRRPQRTLPEVMFDDPDDPAVVYAETEAGAIFIERPEGVARQRRIFARLQELSVPIKEFPP